MATPTEGSANAPACPQPARPGLPSGTRLSLLEAVVVDRVELADREAYEARNFADGWRTAPQIANELSAESGAVPAALVVEYLKAL